MRLRVPCLILLQAAAVSLGVGATPQRAIAHLTATALRVEYRTDPLAVQTREPRLGWELAENDVRGARQTGYQVLVATRPDLLARQRGDLWDTGRVASSETIHVAYGGTPLRSRQRAHWKVRVWDERGRVSGWSAPAEWTTGLLEPGDWTAVWIGDERPSIEDVSTTMLRREFTVAGRVRRAVLYATALGIYEARLNGRRVGDHHLAPEWTDYRTRVQYQAYDVTALVRPGANAIAAILADGWYAGSVGLAQMLTKHARHVYGTHPRLLAQLEVEREDGTVLRVASDTTWRVSRDGPVRTADILDGESYDARREMVGWDTAGFVDTAWRPAAVAPRHAAALVAQPNEPIRVMAEVSPIAITEPHPGVFVFDMGQNMVGWCRLHTRAPAGTAIVLRHAEMLNDDGTIYTDNLRSAKQTDQYIAHGDREETFEPRFTYHGFRYVELTGLSDRPRLEDLTGLVAYSGMAQTGSFESSDALLNRLWTNILWTERGNMLGVPTDCPQRDERLGWMGDILVFAQTGLFNLDMAAFLGKWLADVRDAQAEDGRFPDFAPHPFGKDERFTGAPGWGDAGVVVAWRAYENYGDTRLLAEQFDAAKRWVDRVRRANPELLWTKDRGNDYGDWLNADTIVRDGWPKRGGEVPKEVFATAQFARSADLVARMARVLGREAEATAYGALFERIRDAFNTAYVDREGRMQGDTQAGYALALHFGLLPPSLRPNAVERLVAGLAAYGGHMSTGFHSTVAMMLELTRAGHEALAYRLALGREFPSWGYTIENGATTIWERWDGYVKGRGFQDKGMNSFNHYAIGAVGEWLYRDVLGINPDPASPGFAHAIIRPRVGNGVASVAGSYHSIRGTFRVAWKRTDNGVVLDVTVPPNTTASVYVPAASAEAVLESGRPVREAQGVTFVRMEDGAALFEVAAGRYHFRPGL